MPLPQPKAMPSNHTVAKDRPFQCKICAQRFPQSDGLSLHSESHPACTSCGKRFGSPQGLLQHMVSKGHHRPQAPPSALHQGLQSDPQPPRSAGYGAPASTAQRYSNLTERECHLAHGLLLSQRHPVARLVSSGYPRKAESGQPPPGFVAPPDPTAWEPRRKAVVVDCEMAVVRSGQGEVVSLSVIDFFTGQALVDCLVRPMGRIRDWKADIHGVTPTAMSVAKSRGLALEGCAGAQTELWKHVNKDTILVGHSLQQKLRALRVVHAHVVDTAILASEAVFGRAAARLPRMWSLSALGTDLLGLEVRSDKPGTGSRREKAMTIREVAWWCLRNPTALGAWASQALSGPSTRAASGRKRGKARGRPRGSRPRRVSRSSSASEVLRWEDVIDWEMWPKSPPDSD